MINQRMNELFTLFFDYGSKISTESCKFQFTTHLQLNDPVKVVTIRITFGVDSYNLLYDLRMTTVEA